MDSGESNMFATYTPRDHETAARVTALPADLEIRPATVDDVEPIARLLAWREGLTQPDALKRSTETLNAPGKKLVLVAQVGSGFAGFGRAALISPQPAPYDHVPPGWYLVGVIVDPAYRRRGIASALTRVRLAWIAQRTRAAYYFANSLNRATIDLHERLGFREVCRDFTFPNARFDGGGTGVLFRIDL
jgi:ribosomal protein S18 acetylase RimI-like enzyme